VFKLAEIDARYRLVRPGNRVLDLGCYPGSWSQYCIKKVGPKGKVVGLDLAQPESLNGANFQFIKADILKIDPSWLREQIGPMNIVLSDLAPRTTGVRFTDVARSMELARRAFEICLYLLQPRGAFVCKVFEGQGLKEFKSKISKNFAAARAIRPKAVRKGSREIYLVAQGRIVC